MKAPRERRLLDTNVIVRFFTGEPPEMAAKARRLFERADAGELTLVVVPVILAETIYTLESFYEMERKIVASRMRTFIQARGVETLEVDRLLNALRRCEEENAHFSDAYLAAASSETRFSISSFDRDFDKFKDVRRIEPGK